MNNPENAVLFSDNFSEVPEASETRRSVHTGCVIMAAGLGVRFGGGKLLAEFHGRTMIDRALDAIPHRLITNTVVVYSDYTVGKIATGRGFKVIKNPNPERGQSNTVKLGIAALNKLYPDLLMFLTADQPLLRRETVERLLAHAEAHPGRITVPIGNGRRGSPCTFPRALFSELSALTGDTGGKPVLRAHPELIDEIPVPPEQLSDCDSPAELERLQLAAL